MAETERIVDLLRRAARGKAWHGSAVHETLMGVTAAQARHRPLPAAHSIWEIVLHMTAWNDEVRERLDGRASRSLPAEEDWPLVADPSESRWAEALKRLDESERRLRATVAAVPERRFDELLGDASGPWTVYVTMHGIIQHELYHAGQIALLKKAEVR